MKPRPGHMLTQAELYALAPPTPEHVTVQFIRAGETKPDGRGEFRVNERAVVPFREGIELCNTGAAVILSERAGFR